MRLLIVGTLKGQLTAATKIAMDKGATVTHADSIEQALAVLRSGRGADLLMVDVALDIRDLVDAARRRAHPRADRRLRRHQRRARRGRRHPRRRQGIHPAAARSRADRGGARRRRRRHARDDLPRRRHGARGQARPADRRLGRLGADHRRKRHRQGSAGALPARALARAPRSRSSRVNCAAIPENLLESELFGHEKGAFTGALARRIGKFEEANGGTLLLDEISEMDVRLQAKLLRAIQERVIDRVGGSKPVPVDIRIIATSNRNLTEAVREGKFREDLLFRLNVVNLKIPPLRERPADIIELAQYFVKKYAAGQRPAGAPAVGGGAPRAQRQPLAGQCARAGEHAAPRGAAVERAGDRHRRHPDARTARGSTRRAAPAPRRTPRWPPSRSRATWSAAPSPRSSAT